MAYFCRSTLSLAGLILVAGCDQPTPPTPTPAAAKATEDPITADVDRMKADIRIAAANKRIDELERQVGALQATPEKLDLELLTDRVAALEGRIGVDAPSPGASPGKPMGQTPPDLGQTSRPAAKADGSRQVRPQPSKSSSPGAENRTRPATDRSR